MAKNIPAISVVIPMYNAEKFIGECLESILAQSFKDFEIIIVDDCSTDNSCAIVEKFSDDRIKLIRNKINSGCPGIPRNIAMKNARGEYISFVDADDAIINTALEEFYTVAKKFDADVVHCQKYFQAPGETVTTDKNLLKIISDEKRPAVTTPTWEANDFAERVNKFSEHKISWTPWLHFIKRDLLVKLKIEFPPLIIAEDFLFSFFMLCTVKKFLVVPNTVYIYRINENSTFHKKMTAEDIIHKRVGVFFRGIKYLDDFMNKFKFFNAFPEYKYLVFDFFAGSCGLTDIAIKLHSKFQTAELDKIIRAELEQIQNNTALTAFLFSRMSVFNAELVQESFK